MCMHELACTCELVSRSNYSRHPYWYWYVFPMASSPEELVSDLKDVPELIHAQVNAGIDRDDVFLALFNAWVDRLQKHTKMKPKGKIMVTQAINDGPWTPLQKRDLASVLNDLNAATKASAARRPSQKIKYPENFLRVSIMAKLRSTIGRASRMSMLATEMRNIGIECADEPLLFRLVAILAYTENNWEFSQAEVFKYMDDIQSYIKAIPRRRDLVYIEHYPVSANLLPSDIQQHAFPDGVLPVVVELPELDTVLGAAKMRGRSTAKRPGKVPKWMENVPAEHREAVMTALKVSPGSKSVPTTDAAIPLACSVQGSTSASPQPQTVDAFRFLASPVIGKETLQAELNTNSKPDADNTSDTDEDKVASANTIDDVEGMLVAARSGLRASKPKMKRPAAAHEQVAKPIKVKPFSMKKSADTTKKPACATKKTKIDIDKKPKTNIGTWKNIHSKIWHRARDDCFKKCGDDKKSRNAASEACARAKVKFLKGTLKID